MRERRVVLRGSQWLKVRRFYKRAIRKVDAMRYRIIYWLAKGKTVEQVTRLCGCVRATVYRVLYRYEEVGLDGLQDRRCQRDPTKVTPEVAQQLLSYLDGVPGDWGWHRGTWTLELLSLQLFEDTGVELSLSHIRRVLRQLGCRRGRPRQGLRIPVRGRRKILNAIERKVSRASADYEVFYADEADIDLNPRIGSTYIRRGRQPVVLTPGQNVKRYVASALNWRTGRIDSAFGKRKNSSLFIELLDALCRGYRRAKRLVVILDNYSIHKSKQTKRWLSRFGRRVELVFLPPYSPESNPIERLWKQLHDHVTRNHRHTHIDSLMEAVKQFLRAAQPFPGTKVSTMTIEYAKCLR